MKVKCSTCDKVWMGKDEYEVERKIEENPCECRAEAEKMSTEELLKKIKQEAKQGG